MANFFTCHYRSEIQDLDSNPPCPGSASAKPEDVEEEEEEELEEEDDDSLAGKSQEDTVSPTPEPQGVYEDEEDDEPPTLTMGFDHTRRWAWRSARGWAGREDLSARGPFRSCLLQPGLTSAQQVLLPQGFGTRPRVMLTRVQAPGSLPLIGCPEAWSGEKEGKGVLC